MGSVPLVSILLPVRDAAATLATALRSVARQTETRFECVAVDDGSRDESLAILRTAASSDPRFRVLAAPRKGLVSALTTGLDACRAPFIARMDADDWMHRRRLASQLAALDADPSLAGVGCHVRLFPRSALGRGMRSYETWLGSMRTPADVRREAFIECPLAHPTWLLRGGVFRSAGYRDAGWPEDHDLILRLLRDGHRLGVVPERLLAWRHGPKRLSQTHPDYDDLRFTACRAHHLARGPLARTERYRLWGYGATGRTLAAALETEGKRLAAIVEVHPRRLGQTIRGVRVISAPALGPPDGTPLLVSVAGAGPRGEIRRELARKGYREGVDYYCAA